MNSYVEAEPSDNYGSTEPYVTMDETIDTSQGTNVDDENMPNIMNRESDERTDIVQNIIPDKEVTRMSTRNKRKPLWTCDYEMG